MDTFVSHLPRKYLGILALPILSFIFNVSGIYCLFKDTRLKRTQWLSLVNLCSVEALLSLHYIFSWTRIYVRIFPRDAEILLHTSVSIFSILILAWNFSRIFMAIDRSFGTSSPIRRFIMMTSSKTKRIVLAIWISSILFCVPFFFHKNHIFHGRVMAFISYFAHGTINVFSLSTLITIAIKRKRWTTALQTSSKTFRCRDAKTNTLQAVVLVYSIVCYQLPMYVRVTDPTLDIIRQAAPCVGFSLDPIIHCFLRKSLRQIALRSLLRRFISRDFGRRRSIPFHVKVDIL